MTLTRPHSSTAEAGMSGTRRLAADLVAAALLVFVIAWYWLPATVEQGSAPHDRLFFLGVLPILAIAAVWAPWRRLLTDPLILISLGFLGYLSLSVVWSREPMEFPVLRGGLYGISTIAFLLAVAVLADRRRVAVFRVAVVIAATTAAAAGFVFLIQDRGHAPDRLASAVCLEHPNVFAHYLGFAAILALGAALRSQRIWVRWMWLGSAVLLSVGVLLTRSRAAAVALVLCLMALTALTVGRRAAAVIALALAASALASSWLVEGHINAFVLRGDSGRDVIYRTLVERMDGDLIFGAGLASDDNVVFEGGSEDFYQRTVTYHPHSIYVGTLYYGGLVGLALLLAVVITAVRRGFVVGRGTGDWELLLLLVFGLVCLLVDGQRLVSKPHLSSWLLIWLPIGAIAARGVEPGVSRVSDRMIRPSDDELARVAPGPAVTLVLAVVALLSGWLARPGAAPDPIPTLLLASAAAALAFLLSKVIGSGPGRVAAVVLLAAPVATTTDPGAAAGLLALALACTGLGLLLDAGGVRSPATWLGAAAAVAAGIASPIGALAVVAPIAWWGRSRIPRAAIAVVGAAWVPALLLRSGPLRLDPELLTIDAGLFLVAAAAGAFVGLGGAVPAAIGVLASAPRARWWLPGWLAGGGLAVAVVIDPAHPTIADLLPLAAPLAAAIALGLLWLGHELAQLDRAETTVDPAPLEGRRLTAARVLAAILIAAAVLTPRTAPKPIDAGNDAQGSTREAAAIGDDR